jgi:alpha-tubulin suppressor-like RCC1 family protein
VFKKLVGLAAVVAFAWFGAAPAAAAETTVQGWGVYDTIHISTSPQTLFGGHVTAIASSNAGTFMLTDKGVVFAYGNEHHGALGDGVSQDTVVGPVRVSFPAGVTITGLATSGAYDTMTAIDSTGHAWGWGANDHGQLCNGNETEQNTPIEMPLSSVTAMAGAGSHTLIAAGGHLYSCGENVNGELGIGSEGRTQYPTPQPIAFSGDSATPTYLVASWHTSGAILSDGSYWAWGYNHYGNVGNGTTTDQTSPYEVFTSGVTTATEGGGGTSGGANMAITTNGTYVWGADAHGQLCNGIQQDTVTTPQAISGTWTEVAAGGNDGYRLDTSGRMYACGDNSDGQVGDGQTGKSVVTPTLVLSGVTQITSTAKEAAGLVP